jgi:PAT family beta-lactamase induction signal transducer AmpG
MTIETRESGILAQSRHLRLFTLFILYVAQGVPIGLFWFAIPAWMAAQGASAADIGFVLGMTALPWSLKLVNGFFMDRYTFLPMGRRRAWIIGAQLTMIVLMAGAALLEPKVDEVVVLAAIGFLVNLATTFQDVGVDGLAVDIMEEDERARGSGMMFGGQAIGAALATSLAGLATARLGPAAAYLLSAGFIGATTVYVIWLRERPGEGRLPWSHGVTHARNAAIHVGAWLPILKHTLRSMIAPVSLLWIPVQIAGGFHYGVLTGATPLIGAGELGWSEAQITALVGTGQLVAGIAGLTLGGWIGDRFGAKTAIIGVLVAFLALNGTMLGLTAFWSDLAVYRGFVFGWLALDTLLTVVAQPISMRLCDPRVAATQFTIYMAISNFGITLGAWVLGFSAALGGLPVVIGIVIAGHMLALLLMLTVRYPEAGVSIEDVARQLAEGKGPEPVRN